MFNVDQFLKTELIIHVLPLASPKLSAILVNGPSSDSTLGLLNSKDPEGLLLQEMLQEPGMASFLFLLQKCSASFLSHS